MGDPAARDRRRIRDDDRTPAQADAPARAKDGGVPAVLGFAVGLQSHLYVDLVVSGLLAGGVLVPVMLPCVLPPAAGLVGALATFLPVPLIAARPWSLSALA